MTLRVLALPDPTPETDFSIVVPGINLYDVTGITATLVAASGRHVDLTVTNGTDEVLAIPSGFGPPPGAGPYEYAWQPDLNSSSQSADGLLTTVAIPRLLLPAGYVVGSRTDHFASGSMTATLHDASGNGRDGSATWNDNALVQRPGLVAGDFCMAGSDPGIPGSSNTMFAP